MEDLRHVGRLGLIGDVHAEDALLERAIEELGACGAERLLCVGDLVDGPGDLGRCCGLLARYGALTVRGNHDRWLVADATRDLSDPEMRRRLPAGIIAHLENLRRSIPEATLAYLQALPATRALATRRGAALLCHGLGPNDMAFVGAEDSGASLAENEALRALQADAEVQIVFNGHTHQRMVRHFAGLTVVNAGTISRRNEQGAVLVDLASGEVTWLALQPGRPTEVTRLGSILSTAGS
jgi:predicted phosphodiesterase